MYDDKIKKSTNGCWEWTGAIAGNGYGLIKRPKATTATPAHRVIYEIHRGPIPKGLVIDHLCRNPICVNPDHLEPVTQRENTIRGENHVARQIKRTHCPSGHPYKGENLRISKRGQRHCRQCLRIAARRSNMARKLKGKLVSAAY